MDLRKALGLDRDYAAEENTVSYEIYAASSDVTAEELVALRVQLLDHLLPFLLGYIWQRDRFALQLSAERQAPWQRARTRRGAGRHRDGGSATDAATGAAAAPARGGAAAAAAGAAAAVPPPHLWGCTNFGDNIEDEWFIVWLLLELTRAFPVTARVWDNDGEFLLIEAAYGLPRWLKPETAQNRVWLHGGGFHLVPLPRFVGDPLLGATPSLAQALAAVRGSEIDTAAPAKMQVALLPRVSGFPGKAAELMHVAHALVPARVAHLLRTEPQLLAAAVEAFHYRDPDDVKVAARMAAFPPQDMVLSAPTFSRCLYAQLALQEYAPPRGYPMPMPTDPQYKAAEVGLKLTAGFEMMYANRARFGHLENEQAEAAAAAAAASEGAAAAEGTQQGQQQEPIPSQSSGQPADARLSGDAGWAAFRASLERSGYFRGSLPGSAQHSQLLSAAVSSYQQTAAYRASTAALAAPALRAEQLLSEPVDPGSFPPPGQLPPEGSEAWMAAGAEAQLDAELAQRQAEQEAHAQRKQARRQQQEAAAVRRPGPGGGAGDGNGPRMQQRQGGGGELGAGEAVEEGGDDDDFDPGELAGKLHAFMDMMAGLEGAELPGSSSAAGGGAGGGVDLDEAQFAAELQRVLGLSKAALRGLERRARGGGGGADDDSMSETSSEEGSSFFSDDGEEGSSESEAEGEEEGEQPQLLQRQRDQQGRQRHMQEQQAGAAAVARGVQQPAGPSAAAAEQGEREEEEEGERRRQEAWEAGTATDSDDDAQFMEAYGKAMDAQLSGTRMGESFERAPADAAASRGVQGQAEAPAQAAQQGAAPAAAGANAAAGAVPVDEEEAAAEAAAMRPVDIDLNLVNSLLASYGEQQGLPGPASNLAGLLGLKLPDQPAS